MEDNMNEKLVKILEGQSTRKIVLGEETNEQAVEEVSSIELAMDKIEEVVEELLNFETDEDTHYNLARKLRSAKNILVKLRGEEKAEVK
jgi:hypothetical protein